MDRNTPEFDILLKHEFSRLGFNYDEVKSNGIRQLNNNDLKMYIVEYIETSLVDIDGVGVIFTLSNPQNESNPAIQNISATLFNDSYYPEFTTLIEKEYFPTKDIFFTKQHIVAELTEMLKAKKIVERNGVAEFDYSKAELAYVSNFESELKKEFLSLGFDFNEFETNGRFPLKGNRFLVSSSTSVKDPSSEADYVIFVITVRDKHPLNQPAIEMIHACLLVGEDAMNTKTTAQKAYIFNQEKLPNKREILKDLSESLKIIKARDLFLKSNQPSKECNRRNKL